MPKAKINPNGIPDWTGESGNLPPKEELFLYKGNLFFWKPCECGNALCNRPYAYTEDGEKSYSMTLRLRGDDTGFTEIDILLKIGATIEQIADAYDLGGDKAIAELFESLMDEDPFAKGLTTPEELAILVQMAMMEASGLGNMLRQMMNQGSKGNLPPSIGFRPPSGKDFLGHFGNN